MSKVQKLVGDLDLEELRARLHRIRSTRVITPKVEKRQRKQVEGRKSKARSSLTKLLAGMTPEELQELLGD